MRFGDIVGAILGGLGMLMLGAGVLTFILLGAAVVVAIPATVVYGFWNLVVVPTFAFKAISFLQAMLTVLFGTFVGGLFRARSIVRHGGAK